MATATTASTESTHHTVSVPAFLFHSLNLQSIFKGSYPPPKSGYGKYADYGKYGAVKREAEPEAAPEAEPEAAPEDYGHYGKYGKYASYGTSLSFSSLPY
jgi:hypothetical protein